MAAGSGGACDAAPSRTSVVGRYLQGLVPLAVCWPRPGRIRLVAVPCGLVPPSRLAHPPPQVQVPRATWRGGLKTLWVSPVHLRRMGRSVSWESPFSPRLHRTSPAPKGRGRHDKPGSSQALEGGCPVAIGHARVPVPPRPGCVAE